MTMTSVDFYRLFSEEKMYVLGKNDDAQTSLMKTGGCIEVSVHVLSIGGLREKHKHGDTQY